MKGENMTDRKKALETAIKLEEDGKEFYLKSAEKASKTFANDIFKYLAEVEDKHIEVAKSIYNNLKSGDKWPKLVTPPEKEIDIISIFPKDLDIAGETVSGIKEALDVGISMEEKSIKLYDELSEKATDPFEKRYYIALSREERGHYLMLTDSKDYIDDPAGWFNLREGFRLDG